MIAFSLRGYCRTLRVRIACTPAMMMMRLTTIAITGRRMKRSVKLELGWTGDSALMARPGASAIDRRREDLRRRGERVVDHDGLVVPELERAVADHRLVALETVQHRDEVTAPLTEANELLTSDERRLAIGALRSRRRLGCLVVRVCLLLLDQVHRVPVGGVDDAGRGDDERLVRVAGLDLDAGEHARVQAAVRVVDGGAHPDVPRGGVDLGVDGGDRALPALA